MFFMLDPNFRYIDRGFFPAGDPHREELLEAFAE
jgi:hypothetical protein